MRILLTGASGFVGRHLLYALYRRGHTVVAAGRTPLPATLHNEFVLADFAHDLRLSDWVPRLCGIDFVINAVGIVRETNFETFEAIHVRAPSALFDACVVAGVQRVIQISALGADAGARSKYHLSKRRADEHLAGLPLAWTIVQPSLVYGPDGASAKLFTALACLPYIPLVGNGSQLMQPVHIEDVISGICTLIDEGLGQRAIIPFVGSAPITLREYLATLRRSLGLGRARYIRVPIRVMRLTARAAELLPRSLLNGETLEMLLRGNTGDARPLQEILGRETRAPDQFITPDVMDAVRVSAQLDWLLPLLRYSVALVWIVTGIVSLGPFPVSSSYELLARVGVSRALAPAFLYGAALMDLAFGIATLLVKRRRFVWLAQTGAILLYTIIISAKMPEFWLHPFGPLLKNVPLLAAILVLYQLERR
ncbi:MAG TPA: SDR family oxidoreductase [Steroidobacteraceae bacterium]|nr:SDR family oxidoreductase [Steroidobacteraceae bacterium]